MSELEELMMVFGEFAGEKSILAQKDTAHLIVSGNNILSSRAIEGLKVKAEGTASGILAEVRVLEGMIITNPVHICFGILHKTGSQEIKMNIKIEKGASVFFIAHCIFPKAEKVRHIMDADIQIYENARMIYSEVHYHGPYGGIEVVPKATISVGKNGRFCSDFSLLTGRVGKLEIDYTVKACENAVIELTARVFGHGEDKISIKEKVSLEGENSRGLIKTRIAIEDRAQAEVTGITEGKAAGARGHVDCMEIIKDSAIARAIPIVAVSHPLAKVTHEAAIGSVDKRQLETLMAHGLTPEEAVNIIIKGILK